MFQVPVTISYIMPNMRHRQRKRVGLQAGDLWYTIYITYIHGWSDPKWSYYFGYIFLTEALFQKYLKKTYCSKLDLKFSFKWFANFSFKYTLGVDHTLKLKVIRYKFLSGFLITFDDHFQYKIPFHIISY